ncbi:hypothetical protein [Agreia sp. PsM10]|uniref:hypothetical protein n=1 Tax=Agreia sp. PsM10 TaxID=3030533 RepID=UPI00263AA39E|nr:hypothetical protein [Agreia sp. PsM10]
MADAIAVPFHGIGYNSTLGAALAIPIIRCIYRRLLGAQRLSKFLIGAALAALVLLPVTILISLTVDAAQVFDFNTAKFEFLTLATLGLITEGVYWAASPGIWSRS